MMHLKKTLFFMILITLIACSGGGGGDSGGGGTSDVQNTGSGWINVTSAPTPTEQDSLDVSGTAFISPTWFRCCSGSADDTGVTVTWANETTGESGTAYHSVQETWFPIPSMSNHEWWATIPLIIGSNRLRMTATDPGRNSGTRWVTVQRQPGLNPPSVVSTLPAAISTNISVNSTLSVTFNEPIDPSSISTSTITLRAIGGGSVNGTLGYSNKVAQFTPLQTLDSATTFEATVTTGVKDLGNRNLSSNYVWQFTTRSDYWETIAGQTRSGHTAVWTGTEMIIWGGLQSTTFFNTGFRFNPVTKVWTETSLNGAPSGRRSHSAIWTGTEMIIWGGYDGTAWLNSGFRYNPQTDTWRSLSSVNAPSSANGFTLVWTGSEMIVWGGMDTQTSSYKNVGSRYNPVTDTWTSISVTGVPSGRAGHTAVWTGTEMIIWGGNDAVSYFNSGAKYNPNSDTWVQTNPFAPTARSWHTAVWTGTEMIIWGGYSTFPGLPYLDTGAIYNPASDAWTVDTSMTNAPSPRSGHFAFWTGKKMLIWGTGGSGLYTGSLYDRVSNSWQSISLTDAPPQYQSTLTAVWSNHQMILCVENGSVYEYTP